MAVFLGVATVFLAGAARAADTGNGSKNFSTPSSVPNYFSNEAGPMLGGAAESRRTELYMSQTYGSARQSAAVEAPQPRQHIAMAEPRGRAIRGRSGGKVVAHHVTVHGRPVLRIVARGSTRSHSAVASPSAKHTVSKSSTHVSSSHRRARH